MSKTRLKQMCTIAKQIEAARVALTELQAELDTLASGQRVAVDEANTIGAAADELQNAIDAIERCAGHLAEITKEEIHADAVFCRMPSVWQVMLDGIVLPTTWNSEGAATAGLKVERRRRNKQAPAPAGAQQP